MSQSNKCPECGTDLPPTAPRGLCPACLLRRGLEANTVGDTAEAGAARWTPPGLEELAARFPELEISRLIGRGGMGAVYQARQKQLDRVVALKILPPEMAHDPAFAQRFAREAQAMARLNHPHIVTIYEFGQRGGWYFFIMEFVDGVNLRGLLDSGHVSPREALAIVPQICEALQYAHDQGIVHRDIKPENILLSRLGQVKIADFGVARLMGRAPAHAGAAETEKVMGTPQYMAPEQLERPAEVDHRADIYALGVVFYQMLTGELPAPTGRGKFEPPSKKVHIDVRLDEVVLRALETEPARRYQQASQIKTEVETIVQTPGASSSTAAPAQPRPPAPGSPGTGANDLPARLSRTAVVGAAWAPFVLIFHVFTLFLGIYGVIKAEPHLAWWEMALVLVLGFLWVTAPFGTTICGVVAIMQIRRSRGRLYGLPLAVADALFFPLLILDVLIVTLGGALVVRLLPDITQTTPSDWPAAPFVIVTALLLLSGLLDFFIIRWAWRAASSGMSPVASSGSGDEYPPAQRNQVADIRGVPRDELAAAPRLVLHSRQQSSSPNRGWLTPALWIVVLLLVPLLGLVGISTWSLFEGIRRPATERGRSERAATPAAMPTAPAFGPVMERAIPVEGATVGMHLLSFQTGRVLTPPPEMPARDEHQFVEWTARNRLDVMAEELTTGPRLWGDLGSLPRGCEFKRVPSRQWDITPAEVLDAPASGSWSPEATGDLGAMPATYLFRTRESGMGVLQILGYADNPRSVRVRYKLVQQAAPATTAPSDAATPRRR